jgi:hypothetical protein
MYSNGFDYYPDGLTERDIDLLIVEAFESTDQQAVPTSALLNGTNAHRRFRRIERQNVIRTMRALPVAITDSDGQEAA